MAKKLKNGDYSFGAKCRMVKDQHHCIGAFNAYAILAHENRFPCGFALYGAVVGGILNCLYLTCLYALLSRIQLCRRGSNGLRLSKFAQISEF